MSDVPTSERLQVVILAGGSGTRFWPASRARRPKQFLSLFGDESLLRATYRRARPLVAAPDDLWVVGSAVHAAELREQLPELAAERRLLEPRGRDTAPALVAAALAVRSECGPRATLLVLPSDHHVRDLEGFRRAVAAADAHARSTGELVTFGVRPDRPEQGYGYVEIAREAVVDQPQRAVSFTEKPDATRARQFVDSGRYLWNSGMFLWQVGAFLDAAESCVPELVRTLQPLTDRSPGSDGWHAALADAYERVEPVSIDYAVMEKTPTRAVVPVELGWDDVGSWEALARYFDADADGNVVLGETVALGSQRNLVYAPDGGVQVLIGVEDLVVVRQGDAVLVCRRGREGELKRALAELSRTGRQEHL